MSVLSDSIKKIFSANTRGSGSMRVMNRELVSAYNSNRSPALHSSFCYAPSVNMYFSQNGDVKVCCHNTEYTIGTYPQQSIQEIWNSEKAKELRARMQRYDLSHGCEICEFDIKLRAFNEVRARHFDSRPRHSDYPTMMEFLISNKCNLECVMCSGEFSSLIRKNKENLPPLQFPYDQSFLKQLEAFIPHLKEARFSGSGEAFLINMNYEIWEMIIRLNPTCVIMVQTNGTVLTDRVKNMLQRGNFQIGVSLDSLQPETYEAIRLNASLDKVMENIRFFSDYCRQKSSHFMLAMCVMRQNWQELPAFINLCNELNAAAVLHKVWSPAKYALNNLPAEQLQHIYHELELFDYKPQSNLQQQNLQHYRYFLSVIKNWAAEAVTKTNGSGGVEGLTCPQLLELALDKVKHYLDQTPDGEMGKEERFKLFQSKLLPILEKFGEEERMSILRIIYFENPAKIVGAMNQQAEEVIFENAKKILLRESL